ncbi:MAG: virulence RhuM family protein [Bacteroidales bacterium]|nr:virulence RhuM family protein [Bacteroidales bacterium]
MEQEETVIIYQSGEIELQVSVDKETIWLNTEDIAKLFNVQRPAVVKHIGNIYKTNELLKNSTCSILEQVTKDGKKRKKNYYNLDVIISIGYRVNSVRATQFRIWATNVLKQYIYNGYTINSEKITHQRFKELENDVALLKHRVTNISKTIEDKNQTPKQKIFFDEQVFDAYEFVAGLIKNAKKSIVLIDNYIDETVLTLFSKNKDIDVLIFTANLNKQLQLDIKKYNEQYKPVKIKKFKQSHDRFMIIDNKEVYHFGASLKDLGKKWFACSKFDINAIEILQKLNPDYTLQNKG